MEKFKKHQPIAIGSKLIKALTKGQITHLLSAVFDLLNEQQLNELGAKVDKDIATTLSRLLAPKTREKTQSAPKRIVSDQKHINEWDNLWRAWSDIADDAGNEDGKYVYQEHHWEHPYFRGDVLAEDLDQIGQKMLPRISKIHALEAAEDKIFEAGLNDIEIAIHRQPEWLGATHEGFELGRFTTQCVLQWEWLVASAQAQHSAAFVERILELENVLMLMNLNDKAMVEFFAALSEGDRQQVHEHLARNREVTRWAEKLSNSYSAWHQIYHALCETYSPEKYLENCRDSLHENWRYGLPLVEDALQRKQYAEAEKVITETFSGFLDRFRTEKSWKPEEKLLIEIMRYGYQGPEAEMDKLLKHWQVIAQQLNEAERAAALKFQHVTYESPYQWEAVAKVFKETNRPEFADVLRRLFKQWQAFVFENSVGGGYEGKRDMNDTWIHWLIETGVDDSKDKKWFVHRMQEWLEFLTSTPAQFKKQHQLIYTLTMDLAQTSDLKKQYPRLFEIVLHDAHAGREIASSRRAWLKKMQGEQFIPVLMECWKQNVQTLTPDPATPGPKSYYGYHADWLVVVNELNPAAYRTLIKKWQVEHRRRGNLWKAIKEKNLPLS